MNAEKWGTCYVPSHSNFQYVGRIDDSEPDAPVLHYAGSTIVTRFEGTSLRAEFSDEGDWNENGNQVGFVIDDGEMRNHPLRKGVARQTVELTGLPAGEHDLVIVKLQGPGNGRSGLTFHGLTLDAKGSLRTPPPLPKFKIEVYGDSVTGGEGAGCPAGMNDCGANNGWFSYANVLARHLNGQIHNLGVGGLAVLDRTGYFEDGLTGLKTTYDKLNPCGAHKTPWDFRRYQPDLVIMALGVNDQSKDGFVDLPRWKAAYKAIVRDIHARYNGHPLFLFVVAPIQVYDAYHHVAQVAEELKAEGLRTFTYRYGFEVSGHPTMPESARMAEELYVFIKLFRLAPERARR
jgi:lysophospholipase L1-like esterase